MQKDTLIGLGILGICTTVLSVIIYNEYTTQKEKREMIKEIIDADRPFVYKRIDDLGLSPEITTRIKNCVDKRYDDIITLTNINPHENIVSILNNITAFVDDLMMADGDTKVLLYIIRTEDERIESERRYRKLMSEQEELRRSIKAQTEKILSKT